jgi:LytS/YehU family sensor histidine kinase
MEELFVAILGGILELFGEVILQVLLEAVGSLFVRIIGNAFDGVGSESPILAAVGYLALGLVAGLASLFFLPHHLGHPSRFHGISLLISPLITGLIMSQVGAFLRRKDRTTVRIESFLYGFTFALGIAIIRLAFVK